LKHVSDMTGRMSRLKSTGAGLAAAAATAGRTHPNATDVKKSNRRNISNRIVCDIDPPCREVFKRGRKRSVGKPKAPIFSPAS